MPLRASKMNGFILGFHRLVWCPKWTPASNNSLTPILITSFPLVKSPPLWANHPAEHGIDFSVVMAPRAHRRGTFKAVHPFPARRANFARPARKGQTPYQPPSPWQLLFFGSKFGRAYPAPATIATGANPPFIILIVILILISVVLSAPPGRLRLRLRLRNLVPAHGVKGAGYSLASPARSLVAPTSMLPTQVSGRLEICKTPRLTMPPSSIS